MSPETHPHTDVVLTIQAEGGGYRYHIRVDGEAVATNASVDEAGSERLTQLVEELREVFENGYRPLVKPENLASVGSFLFDLWLEEHWEKISEKLVPGSHRWLVISSDVPTILDLPWELLRLPSGEVLGTDARYGIRRMPWVDGGLAKGPEKLRARPLRVLFMACSPRGLSELDYEKEEEAVREAIVKATAGQGHAVAFDSCDLGMFKELQDRVASFKPHIVHLTGHGQVINELGHFAFEDESGALDLRSSEEIRQRIFAGSDVQCVFVSGCQSGRTPPVTSIGGVCQGLVSVDVPFAIGWAASITDNEATKLAGKLYGLAAAGERIDRALALARAELSGTITVEGQEVVDASWILPVLYASTDQEVLFDCDPERKAEIPERRMMRVEALPGMTEGNAVHFVGRRREQQQLIPALRSGTDIQTVILTGLGGAGKSTLATRLARKLEQDGFKPLALPSSEDAPLSVATLFESVGLAFLEAGMADVWQTLQRPDTPVEMRLKLIVSALNKGRFVVVLDNFETNLDRESRRILSAELAGFYTHILSNLSGGSRLIITSRYLPADVEDLPSTVKHMDLTEFPEASFLKFLLRDETVEERYSTGDLPHDLLKRLYECVGGTPRFLNQIRTGLTTLPAEELQQHLNEINLPEETDENANQIQDLKDVYCEGIFAGKLYGYLAPESRTALSKTALFGIPISAAGIAHTAEIEKTEAEDLVQEWRERTFAYPSASHGGSSTWAINTVLRDWLVGKLTPEERKTACAKAGEFLAYQVSKGNARLLGLHPLAADLEALRLLLGSDEEEWTLGVIARIAGYYNRAGLSQDLEDFATGVLERVEHPAVMGWIGLSHLNRADYTKAREWYGREIDASEDDPGQKAHALHSLASIDLNQGNYDVARTGLQQALKIMQEIGNRAGEASTLHQLALIDTNKGNYDVARTGFQQSLKILQEIGNRAGEASTLANLASIDLKQGYYDVARTGFQQSLEIYQEIGNRAGEAATLHQLASIDLNQGNYDVARTGFQQSLEIKQEIGDRAGEAATLHQLAAIDFEQGNHNVARTGYQQALEIRQEIGDRVGEAATLANLASIDLDQGNYDVARTGFQQSLKILQETGNRSGEAVTLANLASIDLDQGNYDYARIGFRQSLEIYQEIGDRAGEASTLANLATIDLRQGNYDVARTGFQQSLKILQEIGDRNGEAADFYQLGMLADKMGNAEGGMRLVLLCALIDIQIGHGDAESDFKQAAGMAASMGHSPEELKEIAKDVLQSYAADQGHGLIEAAFAGKTHPPKTKPPTQPGKTDKPTATPQVESDDRLPEKRGDSVGKEATGEERTDPTAQDQAAS